MKTIFVLLTSQCLFLLLCQSAGATSVSDILNSDLIKKVQAKWEDLSLKGQLDLSKDANIGRNGYVTGEIGYKFKVQPALTSGLQQRVDSYFIGAGLGNANFVDLGIKGRIQVSYSNLSNNKNVALFQKPAALQKFPFSANQALANLNPGEAASLEFSNSAFVGAGFLNDIVQANYIGLQAVYEKGNHVSVEIYRLQGNQFRIRFLTNRNSGTLTSGLTLKPYLDFGVLDKVINGLFSCKPVDLRRSQGLGDLPLDTMVADYLIDLNHPEARNLYDQVFGSISQIDIRQQFLSLNRPEEFSSGLWQSFGLIDRYYKSQNLLADGPKIVARNFKSRMLSEQLLIDQSSACFKIWKLEGRESHTVSSVRVYDFQDGFSDLFYLRTQNENGKSFINRNLNAKGHRDFEMLFYAERANPADPASIQLGNLTDFVMNSEQEERRLSISELQNLIADFNYQYRTYNKEIDLGDLLLRLNNKSDILQKVRIWIDPLQMRKLPVRSYEDYKALLENYVFNHPARHLLPIPKNPLKRLGRATVYDADIARIAAGLTVALNPRTTVLESFKETRALRKNKLFQFISAGFMVSLFPEEVRHNAVQFVYTLEQDNSTVYTYSSADHQNTDQYKNVSGIMKALESRSFDVETQLKGHR